MELSIRFSRNNSLLCRLIRLRTGECFSHVDLRIGNSVFTALPLVGVTDRGDIAAIDYAELVFEVSLDQVKALRRFYQEVKGADYDWAGALGLGFGRDWQAVDRWYCSELVAMALSRIGILSLPVVRGVSPGELLDLLSFAY